MPRLQVESYDHRPQPDIVDRFTAWVLLFAVVMIIGQGIRALW